MSFCWLVSLPVVLLAADSKREVSADGKSLVRRAIPAVIDGAMSWMNDKDCLSCHRISFSTWAIHRSSEAGLPLDKSSTAIINGWTTDWQKIAKPDRRSQSNERETLTGDPDTVAQILLGRAVAGEHRLTPDQIDVYRQALLDAQQPNGSWKAGGQLPVQKRSKRETQEATTMWSLIALADSSGNERSDVMKSTFDNANRWLEATTEGESTEWWATRILLAHVRGDIEAAQNFTRQLFNFQNEDGGWGWLVSGDSDALATGIALYALGRTGARDKHAKIRRAITFLNDTQENDGSWSVNGTKANYANDVTDTASYWGICWAVIGVLEVTSE